LLLYSPSLTIFFYSAAIVGVADTDWMRTLETDEGYQPWNDL